MGITFSVLCWKSSSPRDVCTVHVYKECFAMVFHVYGVYLLFPYNFIFGAPLAFFVPK